MKGTTLVNDWNRLDKAELDDHITGHWGEDSVPDNPDCTPLLDGCTAEQLAEQYADAHSRVEDDQGQSWRWLNGRQREALVETMDEMLRTLHANAARGGMPDSTVSDRGFEYMTPVPSSYGGHAHVSESSNADGPHIWLRATAPVNLNDPDGEAWEAPLHLTAAAAWLLSRQLAHLVRNHYQGDARPEGAA